MTTRKVMLSALGLLVLGAAGYGLYWAGMTQGTKMSGPSSDALPKDASENAASPKVLYWHDPMVPGQKFDKPGKSPFMDMELVPVYADSAGDEGTVRISPRIQQNLGVRTAEVVMGTLTQTIEAVGSVAYNERDVVVVQARSNGFLEKLHVRAPLDPVRKGQTLAEVYVPEWVTAQEEYLSATRVAATGLGQLMDGLVEGARQRMRLAGMTPDQIRMVESTGKVHARFVVTAPISGVVTELGVREGMTVMSGAMLFRINGLSTVWINAEVPENFASQVRPGHLVEARTAALPGALFKGSVNAILPEVAQATRTFTARIEVANPGGRLAPGMFATVNFAPAAKTKMLMVPTEAVIRTGSRSVVVVAQGDGRFAPVDVEVGVETADQTEIRSGLAAGQMVVVSGQFLIDSEASLRSTTTRMGEMPAPEDAMEDKTTHRGEGKIETVEKDKITLSHGPIPSLDWGPMTMGFKLPAEGMPGNVSAGDAVAFEFRRTEDGQFEIVSISPASSSPAAPKKAKQQ